METFRVDFFGFNSLKTEFNELNKGFEKLRIRVSEKIGVDQFEALLN